MYLYHIVILALIQGITEFLPVSSSGHLVLVHSIFDQNGESNWDENLVIDVAVHVGTLFSVLVYFRRDVLKMLCGLKSVATGNVKSDDSKLFLYVLVGSVPVVIAGLLLAILEPEYLRSTEVIIATTIIFGILLWWGDSKNPSHKTVKDMNYKDAVIIGLSQMIALIPGTSRSGITMTSARFLGYSRTESAHFSLLLAMVAISGSGVIGGWKLIKEDNLDLTFDAFLAVILSFICGLLAIAVMMKFLEKSSFTGFAIYRVALGIILIGLVASGVMT